MKYTIQLVFAATVAVALAGCGSTVKLDDVSVQDKEGQSVQNKAGQAVQDKAGQALTPIDVKVANAPSQAAVVTLVPNKQATSPGADVMVGGGRIVYFDFDSFAIRSEFQSVIEAHARVLKAEKAKKASIEGHADERGGREYNLALGQKRAEAVRKSLSLLGVADAQMEAVSFGEEKPAVLGGSEAAMEKNRRAEIAVR